MSKHSFFQRKVVLLVICLFNHDSPKSSIFMLNIEDFLLSAFLSNKLESFVSCNIKLFALRFDMDFFYKNLIILHHSDNNFLLWHLYQIHTFNKSQRWRSDNISLDLCSFPYDKNVLTFMLQVFTNNRKTLAKHVTWKNHCIIAKFRIIKD